VLLGTHQPRAHTSRCWSGGRSSFGTVAGTEVGGRVAASHVGAIACWPGWAAPVWSVLPGRAAAGTRDAPDCELGGREGGVGARCPPQVSHSTPPEAGATSLVRVARARRAACGPSSGGLSSPAEKRVATRRRHADRKTTPRRHTWP